MSAKAFQTSKSRRLRSNLFRVFLFACILVIVYPVYMMSKEYYYVHYVGLHKTVDYKLEDGVTSAYIPDNFALVFIDTNQDKGYIYLKNRKYGSADYSFALYKKGQKIEQKGTFVHWKYFPWQKARPNDKAIFVGGSVDEPPYFFWHPTGLISFCFGKMDRVSLVPLVALDDKVFATFDFHWVKVGSPDY